DTSDMEKCARDLEAAALALNEVVPIALKEGAQVTAFEARRLASWSSRIPASIRVDGAGTTVFVRAGGANAPHASVFEHGGKPGVFHHPVFGHRPYVAQTARPFLAPASISGEATTERVAEHETDRVLRARSL